MTKHPVLFSCAEESFDAAARELLEEFPRADVERLGPDLGLLTGVPVVEVASAVDGTPLVFVRHLTAEVARVDRDAAADPRAVAAIAAREAAHGAPSGPLAVQTWASGTPGLGYSAGQLAGDISKALVETPVRAGAMYTLSACLHPAGVSVGLNRTADSLADWPGGRVRLGRGGASVSRAEHKLEELLGLFPITLPEQGRAVDLGASPGGWTRLLRRQGLTVWAVDPADLDPRVASDPSVYHERTTAGEFLRTTRMTFDVAVNDMRMTPDLSCRVMLDAAPLLRRDGLAIMTLKTGGRRQVDTVRDCLTMLGDRYAVRHARQLHHNRSEVTVVCQRR